MLLGHKKNNEKKQNWCLILNPIANEIDKQKIAAKISEAFNISVEESGELVNNTPIILLDNLTRSVATTAKEYFKSSNSEIFLTNDVYVKRKCYRTVWPETPNLSFLNPEVKPEKKSEPEDRALDPEEALNEIRSMAEDAPVEVPTEEIVPEAEANVTALSDSTTNAKSEDSKEEHERVVKELNNWQEKFYEQQREIERLREVLIEKENEGSNQMSAELLENQKNEIDRQKALLSDAEEKYTELQQEYQQARNLFEDKLINTDNEMIQWKHKANDLAGRIQSMEEVNKELEESVNREKEGVEIWRNRYEEQKNDTEKALKAKKEEVSESDVEVLQQEKKNFEQRSHELEKELDIWKEDNKRLLDEIEAVKNKLHEGRSRTEDIQAEQTSLSEEKQQLTRQLQEERNKLQTMQQEILNLKERNLSLQEGLRDAEQKKSEIDGKIGDQSSKLEAAEQEKEIAQSRARELHEQLVVWKEKALNYEAEIQKLEHVKEELKKDLVASREKYAIFEANTVESHRVLNQQIASRSADIEKLKLLCDEAAAKSSNLEKEKQEVKGALEKQVQEFASFQGKFDEISREIDQYKGKYEEEIRLKMAAEEHVAKLQQEKGELENAVHEVKTREQGYQIELQNWQSKLDQERAQFQAKLDELQLSVQQSAEKMDSSEKSRLRLIKELEERANAIDQWNLKCKDLEYELKEQRETRENMEQSYQLNRQALEERERELEASRKQVRELHTQLEQRDMLHRRTQATNELSEKESRLKSLVSEQEKIESEIRNREENMQKILVEQERLEKEIIEGKQQQRHYFEQSKKSTKAPRQRPAKVEGTSVEGPEQITDEETSE